jgi:sulfite reductase (NADPH) flavoprotein alpha-component
MNDLILTPRQHREQKFEAYIPEHAPFSEEQRAWLNGFLAGLFSRPPSASGPAIAPPAEANTLQPLTILFGTQTGNAEILAKRAAKIAAARGFAPAVRDLAQCDPSSLGQEKQVLVIISTYGDGEPPDTARTFWELLHGETAPDLSGLRFSVCGLGDTNYPKFCHCGKDFDRRLGELKAQQVFPRADCDLDYERTFVQWLDGALRGFAENGTGTAREYTAPGLGEHRVATESLSDSLPAEPAYSRRNPFPAPLVANRLLSGPGSAKEIRHFEFSIAGSGLHYQAGDALAVFPENCPELAGEIIRALGCAEDVPVHAPGGEEVPLRQALLRNYDITRISKALLEYFANQTGDPALKKLASPGVNGELEKFLWGREVIDLLLAHPERKVPPPAFVGMLKKLQPRLYSISSSPLKHPDQAHLTVGVVRYQSLGRARKGICSSFLADRVSARSAVPVFLHPNKNFRPPSDAFRPMIMVGPGTGIAPFRAFLQEHQARGATGKNWLFFGDQHAAADFLYRQELEDFFRNGTLTRFDTAFSRDQPEKIYVQRRMIENARELFAWLEEGAHFYVCGDASRMARDVDAALHDAIQSGGGRTPEQAAEYVRQMKNAKRYQRDVY